MRLADILLLAVALSMDAAAVGMTDGMTDSKMPLRRVLLIAAFFGVFQAAMPLAGYFLTKGVAGPYITSFQKASSWISFIVLALIGGKMIFDGVKEMIAQKRGEETLLPAEARLSVGKIALQAVATSIDALAVGVAMHMAAVSPLGLFPAVGYSAAIIGVTTFLLGIGAVYLGKFIGDRLADKAELIGGIVLVGIGVKLLLEGLL